jgi:hypothetical protein
MNDIVIDYIERSGNAMNEARVAMREAELELVRRARLIDNYQRDNYAHERLIGELRTLLRNDDLDAARDLVEAEYGAIHGPND